jgi:hypothetical protein
MKGVTYVASQGGVDDWNKGASFLTGAIPRRSTSSLGDICATSSLIRCRGLGSWFGQALR